MESTDKRDGDESRGLLIIRESDSKSAIFLYNTQWRQRGFRLRDPATFILLESTTSLMRIPFAEGREREKERERETGADAAEKKNLR